MQFKKTNLPSGERVNAIASEDDITFYITKIGAVYKAELKSYANLPLLEEPYLMVYCDEVAGLNSGGYIERRGGTLKIRS